jgi:hypothetical protein
MTFKTYLVHAGTTNELAVTGMRLLVKDLLDLYPLVNDGISTLISRYWPYQKKINSQYISYLRSILPPVSG